MSFKSGFVAIIGRPNVGKSTLLNGLVNEKISIISNKPQTTRNSIRAIVTQEDYQVVFIDTPGIHKPRTKLGEYMVEAAEYTFNQVDAVLFVVDATEAEPGTQELAIAKSLGNCKTPVFLIINKIDLIEKQQLLPVIQSYQSLLPFSTVIPVSSLNGDGLEIVIGEIKKILPEGPMYFPEDSITDQTERALTAELIREKFLHFTNEEVPHGIGIEIEKFKQRPNKPIIDIEAIVYCERDSHKSILIGKNGSMLKRVGSAARKEIEALLGVKVFLQIWVKVKREWRNDEKFLGKLGYQKQD